MVFEDRDDDYAESDTDIEAEEPVPDTVALAFKKYLADALKVSERSGPVKRGEKAGVKATYTGATLNGKKSVSTLYRERKKERDRQNAQGPMDSWLRKSTNLRAPSPLSSDSDLNDIEVISVQVSLPSPPPASPSPLST